MATTGSSQFVDQRLCLFQIDGIEAFGEPAVDRREEIAGFGPPALLAPEQGKARASAQFPELGPLLRGDAEGFAIQFLGSLGMSLPQQQLAFLSIQLRCKPTLPCPFRDPQSVVQQGRGLFNLQCDLTRLAKRAR